MSPHGADASEIDSVIEAGFVVRNVTVLHIAPLYLTCYVRLWRDQTVEEKKRYPSSSITSRSAMPAAHPRQL